MAESIRDRLALGALDYPVPASANRIDFMLGGLTLAALVLLAVSGIVLTQFYSPTPFGAHDSIVYVLTTRPGVSLMRDAHVWSASAALVLVFAHLASVFWRRAYRSPREGLWWSGVILLGLLFGLAFTGTVLRADQEGAEALAHAIAGARMAGPAGALLRPDFTPSVTLLTRMYAMHVAVLPLVVVGLVGLHMWLIRHLGISAPGSASAPFRTHLRRLSGAAFLLVAIIGVCAVLWPAPLLAPGVDGFEVTKPFWPFLWVYAAENTFGMNGMLIAPAVLFGFLALVPATDRGAGLSARVTRVAGIGLFALMIAAIVYAALAPGQSHLGMNM